MYRKEQLIEKFKDLLHDVSILDEKDRIDLINNVRKEIHEISPFKNEPVDCVLWVNCDDVVANDYNPNKVAPPEMQLLEVSIINDGYTQPIVTWNNEEKKANEVIDGFHRNRVGKESSLIKKRTKGYLPIVSIRSEQAGKNDRIASTIRHNRARGKHQIDAMSEIVIELKNRNWKNSRISKELGMDEDEVLRLCQITGLEHLFTDADFSKSWDAADSIEDEYEVLNDEFEEYVDVRTVNTSDPDRIFHTFEKWECHKAGFYAQKKEGMTNQECEIACAEFLSDSDRFESALKNVISEWKHSCEHYLTNKSMNRIAWLGQASMCYATGIPSRYCSGFNLLSKEKQEAANLLALKYLNIWLLNNGLKEVSIDDAMSSGRQVEIY
jgi:ParB-like chromosome segregation protein Spo0J